MNTIGGADSTTTSNLQSSMQSNHSLAVGAAAVAGMALYALKAREARVARRSQSRRPVNKTEQEDEDISPNSAV